MTFTSNWIPDFQNLPIENNPRETVDWKQWEIIPHKVGDWLFTNKVSVSIKIPECYDTNLPEFDDVEEHYRMTQEDIDQHFRHFLDFREYGGDNIRYINDVEFEDGLQITPFAETLECDYCESRSPDMRCCGRCSKNICDSCWEGKTKEIHSRHLSRVKFKHTPLRVYCDSCLANALEVKGVWLCKKDHESDLCPQCHNFAKDPQTYQHVVSKAPLASFGSFLNWIPLLKHEEEGHMLLYNMVPGSSSYHKVCLLATEQHGMGLNVVSDKSLTEIIKELQEAESEQEETCKKQYPYAAIPYIMNKRGWEVYFG